MDYKAIDTQKNISHIEHFSNNILVEDILHYSNFDKLRVYPALFELKQSGFIEVFEGKELVAPLVFR